MDTALLFLALLLGPALAVLACLAFMRWERVYQRRLDIFHAMMRSRRQWLSDDWIGGLNLVPIEFGRHEPVMIAFQKLVDGYASPAWKGAEEQRRRIVIDTENAACEMLQRMAEALRVDIRGSDLRTRLTTPYGWTANDIQERQSRDMMAQVLQGQRALRVEISPPPVIASPPQPRMQDRAPERVSERTAAE